MLPVALQQLLQNHQISITEINSFSQIGQKTLIMHPLPRGQELPVAFDTYPQAKYFDQVKFGKFMRMALIEFLLFN